jgi:addiction module RelE/StbE family toxin
MDLEVRWSPEAIEDLESIADYISRDSEYYARAVVTDILSESRNLGKFPLIGRIVPEIADDHIRERFVYSYRLVYKIEPSFILIVAVIHGKRLLENVIKRIDDNKQ